MKYDGATYLYRKDVQGNVIALIKCEMQDQSVVVSVGARYIYDAWGNHSVINANGAIISDTSHIANLNLFRYRGYYFDTEIKLYFLKTRYYDAETGRFMTIDDISYIDSETINGLNLYSYCANNPITNIDPNGNAWWEWLLLGVAAIVAVAAIVVGTILTGGAATVGVALLGSALSGASVGFLASAGTSIISQGMQTNWDFSKIDPSKALISGAIGAGMGAIGGMMSYGLGTIGSAYGNTIGNFISSLTIKGYNVGKVFSYIGGTKLFTTIFGLIGKTTGAVLGTYISNVAMNNLFGNNIGAEENLKESIKGEIHNSILSWVFSFFKWIRN